MIASLLLMAFAWLVVVVAVRTLPDAAWTRRAPRLGVIAWQTVSLAVPISLILAGTVLALPVFTTASGDLAGLLGACEFMLRQHYETPGGALVHVLGVAIALVLVVRTGWVLTAHLRMVRRERRLQRRRIALVGAPTSEDGVRLVDDDRPAVFCIPGRRPDIVMTTAAVSLLSAPQRAVAVAHERAHLTGRHDVALTVAAVLRGVMPRVRLFAVAESEIAILVEMHADDQAIRGGERRDLAVALVALAEGQRPAGALAVNGGCAVQRVRRLLDTSPGLPLTQRCSISLGAAALILAPVIIALAPALETALMDYCGLALHA